MGKQDNHTMLVKHPSDLAKIYGLSDEITLTITQFYNRDKSLLLQISGLLYAVYNGFDEPAQLNIKKVFVSKMDKFRIIYRKENTKIEILNIAIS